MSAGGGGGASGEVGTRGERSEAPIVVLSGDVPLVSAETIAELVQAHEQSGASATMASTVLDDPSGYGRVVRDEHGAVQGVVETKADGDATHEQLRIREVNTGVYVFAAGALRAALPRLSSDNAQGELYLPQALDLIRADGGTVAAHAVADERAGARRQRPRGARAGAPAGPADDPRAAHGGGGRHRRSWQRP